jgi:hypothetical protein
MQFSLHESSRAPIEGSNELTWSVDLNHRLTTFNSEFLRHAQTNFGP